MKKTFLFILLFFISINSSFALTDSEKTNLVKQADKIYFNFEKKISKLDNKKQLEIISNITDKISPYTIYRDKISEKNKILLNNLFRLFSHKKETLEENKIEIWKLQNQYFSLKAKWNYNEAVEIENKISSLWWIIDRSIEKETIERMKLWDLRYKLEGEFYDLKAKWEYSLAKEKQEELTKLWGILINDASKITDSQLTIEKLKKEYYSYRTNKQWDLMREKENELAKYKVYFWDNGEILTLNDSRPLVYTERWSVWWVDTKAQQAYDQAKVNAIKSSDLNMQLYTRSDISLSTVGKHSVPTMKWFNEFLLKWVQKWINDEIITRAYIDWNEPNSAWLRWLEKTFWKLDWKTIYQVQVMLHNQYLWYYKNWKLLDPVEFAKANSNTQSSFSSAKTESQAMSIYYLKLWYYLDSKKNALFDSSLVAPELQDLEYIDLK